MNEALLEFRKKQLLRTFDSLLIGEDERTLERLLMIAEDYENQAKAVGIGDPAYSQFITKMNRVLDATLLLEQVLIAEESKT